MAISGVATSDVNEPRPHRVERSFASRARDPIALLVSCAQTSAKQACRRVPGFSERLQKRKPPGPHHKVGAALASLVSHSPVALVGRAGALALLGARGALLHFRTLPKCSNIVRRPPARTPNLV